jgi:transcriptional regulator with XRE-family HTH domain
MIMDMFVNRKVGEISSIVDNYYSSLFVVDNIRANKLGDFVRKTRDDKRLSVKDVSVRSSGEISAAYVNRIENEVINLSIPKQRALAKGLGVDEEIIFALVTGKNLDDVAVFNEGLARGLENLSPGKRKIALRQISGIIESLADSDDDFDYGDFSEKK